MKKNNILVTLAVTTLIYAHPVFAWSWQDLWLRPDQQGEKAMAHGDPASAANLFTSKEWKGSAFYKAGEYKQATESFKDENTPLAHYNRGNSLAMQGDYQAAIAAYTEALNQDPKFADAQHNRDILEKLLKQQQQQQQSSSDSQQQEPKHADKDQKDQQQQKSQQDNQQQASNEKQKQQSSESKSEKESDNADNKQNPEQKDAQGKQAPKNKSQPTEVSDKPASSQTKVEQATEQWLKRIPDDPGGLLRQKFLRDHKRYQMQQQDNV